MINKSQSSETDDYILKNVSSRTINSLPGLKNRTIRIDESLELFLAFVMGIVSLVTILCNTMVFISFKMEKKLRTLTNYFLLSLAFADLMVGMFSIPFFAQYTLLNKWILGPITCNLWLSEDYTVCQASTLHLLAICLDRYFSVTWPITYRIHRTSKRIFFALVIAWFVAIIMTAPWIWLWPFIDTSEHSHVKEYMCYVPFYNDNLVFIVVTNLASFFLPVTIMAVLYMKIYLVTRVRDKTFERQSFDKPRDSSVKSLDSSSEMFSTYSWKTGPNRASSSDTLANVSISSDGDLQSTTIDTKKLHSKAENFIINYKKQDKKAAKTLTAILIVFIITWAPYSVCSLVNCACGDCVNKTYPEIYLSG